MPKPICKQLRTPNDTVYHVAPSPEAGVFFQRLRLSQLLHCLNYTYHHIPDQDFFHFPDTKGKLSSLVFANIVPHLNWPCLVLFLC